MFNAVKKTAVFLIVLTAIIRTTNADISGKITNQAGKGIADASLKLVVKNITTTTGADGSFALLTSAVGIHLSRPQDQIVKLHGDFLNFNLFEPSAIKIEIFDVNGTLIKKESLPDVRTGSYRFNVKEAVGTAKLVVLRVTTGSEITTFQYIPLNSIKKAFDSFKADAARREGRFAKITAVIDTLKVSATNYISKSVPVTSYDSAVNIALDTVDNSAVTVRLDLTRQKIDGFGINNNWKPLGTSGINACFDSVNGLGLSILRIGMFSSGDLFSNNNWDDVKNAKAKGCKYIIGSTWSPPGDWKSGQKGGAGSENGGGHLNKDKYTAWADRIAAFAGKVKQGSGAELYAMSIGNEPDFASCGTNEPCNGNYPTTLYTAEEMVAFIKVAGPKIRAAGCKVMAPEASEWIHTWSDTSGCCSVPSGKPSSDPLGCGCFQGKTTPCKCAPGKGYSYGKYLYEDKEAWAALDILGVHQYDSQRAEPWPDYIPEKDRKPVWQTEMSGVKWWPEGSPSTTIENGLAVAGWIHDALTVGEANAWLYWWYNGGSDTNEGLLINGQDTKRHYTFGNFTKYVRPGMIRVEVTGKIPANVLMTAFKGSDGKVVIVAINKGSEKVSMPVTIAGGTVPASFTPIVTSGNQNENWSSKTAVPVSNNSFTAELAGKSITTFVGK